MNTRNYRVMKTLNENGNFEFGIYEVYYDPNRKVVGWTEEPVTPLFPSENELLQDLKKMQQAFREETLSR